MNTDAIVYTSNTGYTAEYAKIIAKRTGLLVYSFDEARKNLPKKSRIIYLGWLMAGKIKGYKKAPASFILFSRICFIYS